jgi:glycosidase
VLAALLETYRGLISVRKGSEALRRGTYRQVTASRPDAFAFLREAPTERVLVVTSFATVATQPTLDLASLGITSATAHERIFGTALPAVTPQNASAYPLPLAAHGAIWILLQ